ncbi:hypothetical protein WMY93_008197 [Mugilogobius chulae]|uniref:Uncharacterized protein n=1 Tax=Mugilogobius chulae TaxID=88201 RepID=A0AAW0PK84_9GOBI
MLLLQTGQYARTVRTITHARGGLAPAQKTANTRSEEEGRDGRRGEDRAGCERRERGASCRCSYKGELPKRPGCFAKTSMGGCVGSHHDSTGSLNENSDGTGGGSCLRSRWRFKSCPAAVRTRCPRCGCSPGPG